MKSLYLLATPTGAGKTTAAFTLLPGLPDCREFVNADEIARGLSPFQPGAVSIQAGRLMLAQRHEQKIQTNPGYHRWPPFSAQRVTAGRLVGRVSRLAR
jgi:predicted ABC-type ATPase